YDGTTWNRTGPDVGSQLEGVWGTGPTDVWVAGQRGVIAHFDGSTWVLDTGRVTTEDLHAVAGTDGANAWIAGDKGVLLHYEGGMWTARKSGTTAALYGLWAGSELWAVGQDGAILHGSVNGFSPATFAGPTLHG